MDKKVDAIQLINAKKSSINVMSMVIESLSNRGKTILIFFLLQHNNWYKVKPLGTRAHGWCQMHEKIKDRARGLHNL